MSKLGTANLVARVSKANFQTVSTDVSVYTPIMKKVVHYACLSPDQSTQNAAVLLTDDPRKNPLDMVLPHTWSVNEFPPSIEYSDERWERPGKYSWIGHAEEGCVAKAARFGIPAAGTTMVCPWAACAPCGRLIVQAGIKHLVTLKPQTTTTHERWDDSIAVAMTMFEEAGVIVTFLEGSLGCTFSLRRNGEDVYF